MNLVGWMKGICHVWSGGRHFPPSRPGDRYLKLSSQKRSPDQNRGEHRLVRRSGAASSGTALLVFGFHIRSFPRIEVLTISLEIWYPGTLSFPSDGSRGKKKFF